MIKIRVITAILIFNVSAVFAQQYGWVDLFGNMPDTPTDTVYIGGEPYYGSYTDLFFINDNEGWVTSLQQNENQEFLIFHTVDGGQTWEIQKHWEYSHAICMLDAENGYLGDHSGFVMVTHDGGDTWAYHGATGSPVTDISFAPGSDTGYVTTDESYYFWQITPVGVNQFNIGHLNYWSGISATDEAVWFCGGIQVFYLDLAQQSVIPEFVNHCGYFGPVFFIDKDHGWIGNDCEIRGFVEYDYYWPVIHSTAEDAITCLHATDTNQLWATTFDGHIYHASNAWDYGYIPQTNYYWSNVVWEDQPHPKTGELLSTIMFTSPNCGYACGNNNTILKYTLVSSVAEHKATAKLQLHPNPTTGLVNIETKNPFTDFDVQVFDVFGKQVVQLKHQYSDKLDLSALPPALYLVKVTGGGQVFFVKIIKQ